LLSPNNPCKIICAEKNWLLENKLLLKNINPENIFETDDHWLKSISLLKTPNQVLGVFYKKSSSAIKDFSNKISLMLDDLQDPGNLGTIIRIADWFAIENIICSENSVDCYNPKVVQSSMGSLSRVNVFYTNLLSFIEKNKKIDVYATTLSGNSIFKLAKINEGIILLGNESKGIKEDLLKLASQQITIPKIGHAESLNAAVAAGIMLSQILKTEFV
jgi:RNA methyltransferase, TrmH family